MGALEATENFSENSRDSAENVVEESKAMGWSCPFEEEQSFSEHKFWVPACDRFLRWILTTPLSCLLESPRPRSMSPRAKKQSKKLTFLELPWNFIDFNDFSIQNLHFTIYDVLNK